MAARNSRDNQQRFEIIGDDVGFVVSRNEADPIDQGQIIVFAEPFPAFGLTDPIKMDVRLKKTKGLQGFRGDGF